MAQPAQVARMGVRLEAAGGRWRRASRLGVVSLLLVAGCTAAPPAAELPQATVAPRPTQSGPTPSLPLARPAITARSEEFIRQISVQGVPIFPNR